MLVGCFGAVSEIVQAVLALEGLRRLGTCAELTLATYDEHVPWLSQVCRHPVEGSARRSDVDISLRPRERGSLAADFARQLGEGVVPHHPGPLPPVVPGRPIICAPKLPLEVINALTFRLHESVFVLDPRCGEAALADYSPRELWAFVRRAPWIIATDGALLHMALLAGVPCVGVFQGTDPGRYIGGAHSVRAFVAPEGNLYGVTAIGLESALKRLLSAPTVGIEYARPQSDVLFIMPYLSAGGGERATLYAAQALERHAGFSIHVVATGEEGVPSAQLTDEFRPFLHARLHNAVAELRRIIDALRPRSIIFYNNITPLEQLDQAEWRPERCVFVVHTVFAGGERAVLTSRLGRRHLTHVIAVSERTASWLRSRGWPCCDRVHTIRNAVPQLAPQAEDLRGPLGIPEEALVLGYVGRLDGGKRVGILMDAVTELPQNVYALIVGWGPDADHAAALSEKHDRIIYAGPTTEVAPYYRTLNVCVLPSITEGGVPYTLMEAATYGNALMTTLVSDVDLLFRDRESALFITPDVPSIVTATQWLLEDRRRVGLLGEAAKAIAAREFTLDRLGREYYTLLIKGGT